ncbi:MAG: PKD-like domain-containing protein [Janthinobacterium lividum]
MKRWLLLCFLTVLFGLKGFAQTYIDVDLTAAADITKTYSGSRSGSYCNDNNCIVFNITLNANTDLLNFTADQITGASYYTVHDANTSNCGPLIPIGTPACISGLTHVIISFCKPGGNSVNYTITASSTVKGSDPITLRQGCTGTISVTGLTASSTVWTSIYPGAAGAYNSYLSCNSGCTSTNVTPGIGAPDYIDYRVSGTTSTTGCEVNRSAVVRVYTVPPLLVTINPNNAVICNGNAVTLSANVTGGNAPYTYYWTKDGQSISQTTSSISIAAVGTYRVTVSDQLTNCSPVISQPVTVTAATTPAAPTAPGTSICKNTATILTATAPGGTYNWYDANRSFLATGASFTTPNLSSTTTFYVDVTSAAGCTSSRTPVLVTVNDIPAAPIASGRIICSGNSTTLTASGSNGSYQWFDAATGGNLKSPDPDFTTPILSSSTTYYVQTTVNNCTSSRTPVVVTVNPTPSVTSAANGFTCYNTPQSYVIESDVSDPTFSWSRAFVQGISNAARSEQNSSNITESLINTTPDPINVIYYITPKKNNCTGQTFTYTVTINPRIYVNSLPRAITCSNMAPDYTIKSNIPSATFIWSREAVPGISNDAISGQTSNTIREALNNTTPLSIVVTYVIVPYFNGCAGNPFNYRVTVSPIPNITSLPNGVVCNNEPHSYEITSSNATFSWSRAEVPGISNNAVDDQSGSTITETLVNTTSAPIDVAYTIFAEANNCTSLPFTYTLTVKPTPALRNTPFNQVICSEGTSASVPLTSKVSGTNFIWSATASPEIRVLIANGTTDNIPAQTIVNTGTRTGIVTYTIRPFYNTCEGVTSTYTITVNPKPAVTNAASDVICSGTAQAYNITSNVSGTTFSWSRAVVSGISNAAVSDQTSNSITEALINTTSAPIDVAYTIIPTANNCPGNPSNYTLTVKPTPAAPTASGTNICSGSNTTLTASGSTGTFQWFDDVTGGTQLSTNASFTTLHLTNTTTYYVQTTVDGCISPRTSVTVTVDPIPDAPTVDGIAICDGSQAILTATAPGGTYNWYAASSGGTPLFTGTSFTTLNLLNTTNYYVDVTSAADCISARTLVTVTVNPIPAAPTAFGSTICSGNTARLTASGSTGTYQWFDAESGGTLLSPNASFTTGFLTSNTTFYVQTTVNDCISARTAVTVAVTPIPPAPVANSNSPVCNGTSLILTTPAVTGATYSWTGPDNFTSNLQNPVIPTATSRAEGTYSLTITVNDCTSDAGSTNVIINPTPITPVAGSNSPICAGETINLTANNIPGATYSWTGPEGYTSAVQNPVIDNARVAATGTYTVKATVNGCISAGGTVDVTVNPIPVAPTLSSNSPVCETNSLNLSANSIEGATYSWTGPNNFTSNLQNPIIPSAIPENSRTYYCTASVNGCISPAASITVTVYPKPALSNTSFNQVICSEGSSAPVTLTSNVSGTNFIWTATASPEIKVFIANGTTDVIPAQTLVNPGLETGTVTYTIKPFYNDCPGETSTYTITVNPKPALNNTSFNQVICSEGTSVPVELTSNVSGTNFIWSATASPEIKVFIANGTTDIIPAQTLVNPSLETGTVTYTIKPFYNECPGVTSTYTITVNPKPVVMSDANGDVCSGTAQPYAIISNITSATFTWSRAEVSGISNAAVSGQTSNSIAETLINTTSDPIHVAYIIIPATNDCTGHPFTYTLTVNPISVLSNTTLNQVVCSEGISVPVRLISNVRSTTFKWEATATSGITNFTASGTDLIPAQTLINAGTTTGTVTYIIKPFYNTCEGITSTYTITVNPKPVVMSDASDDVCNSSPQNYEIRSKVIGATFSWSRSAVEGISNDAVTAQTSNFITEALVNTTSSPIIVTYTIVPEANGCIGPAFQYQVTVKPTSTLSNASFNQVICTETTSAPVQLTSNVIGANFTWTATASPEIRGFTADGTDLIPAQTLVNTGSIAGNVTYQIKTFYNDCEGLTYTYTITVNPKPATPAVNSNSPVCDGTSLKLTTPVVAGATYAWTGPNGFTSDQQNPEIANAIEIAQGTYSLIVIVNGCSSDAGTTTVTVNPIPPAPLVTSNGNLCEGEMLRLTATATATQSATYHWIGPNGFTSSVQNPVIDHAIVAASGNYIVKITVNGCTSAAASVAVLVNPIPTAPTANSNSPVCATTNLNLSAETIAGATYRWTGPNGFTSAQQNPVITAATPANSGIYTIMVSVGGCESLPFSINVLVTPLPAEPVLASNSSVCSGSQIELTCTAFQNATYRWTGPNGFTSTQQNPIINNAAIANQGRYIVVITTPGCTVTNTAFIDVKVNLTPDAPVVNSNGTLCIGQTLKLSATTITGAIYNWTGPNIFTSNLQNPEIANVTTANAGKYLLTVTVNGCTSDAATTTVIVNLPTVVLAGNDQIACASNPAISISGNISGGSTTGIWSTTGSGSFPAGNTSLKGTYFPSATDVATGHVTLTLTATNTAPCAIAASSFKITFTQTPVVFAGEDQAICLEDQANLNGKITNGSGGVWSSSGTGTFSPNNNSLTAIYRPSEKDKAKGSIILTLFATGNDNCAIISDQVKISLIPAPKVFAGYDIYIMEGEKVTLQPAATGTELKYNWTPNLYLNNSTLKNPVLTGAQDITYTLTVTGTAGCVAQDQVFIKVLKPISIPNTFTPNADGINDTWGIKELNNYPDVTVKIFNRYGIQLFYSQGYGTSWDGTFNGQQLPVGTYYYLIDLKTYGKLRSGPVTIIR